MQRESLQCMTIAPLHQPCNVCSLSTEKIETVNLLQALLQGPLSAHCAAIDEHVCHDLHKHMRLSRPVSVYELHNTVLI